MVFWKEIRNGKVGWKLFLTYVGLIIFPHIFLQVMGQLVVTVYPKRLDWVLLFVGLFINIVTTVLYSIILSLTQSYKN